MTDLPATRLRYDTPPGGLDPFDITEPRTQHVVEARGWGRGWVPADDFVPPDAIYQDIEMGYRYLAVLEKLAVVVSGQVVREWPITAATDRAFRRTVAFERGASVNEDLTDAVIEGYWTTDRPWLPWTRPYRVLTQDLSHPAIGSPTYNEALTEALSLPTPALIARVLSHTPWH